MTRRKPGSCLLHSRRSGRARGAPVPTAGRAKRPRQVPLEVPAVFLHALGNQCSNDTLHPITERDSLGFGG